MIINSLDKMEQIVASKKELHWEGWDVLKRIPSATAWKSPSGVFVKGRWYLQNRFPITENGWKIPGNLIG